MLKNLKFALIFSFFVTTPLLAEEGSSDITLGQHPNAFSLKRGALQINPFAGYINIDAAETLGFDIDPQQSQGVGEFLEYGMNLKFGLAKTWLIDYRFSAAEFSYSNKDSDISTQDLKIKKSFRPSRILGHTALEVRWSSHRTHRLDVAGSELQLSNVLNDTGFGLRYISSHVSKWGDFHKSISAQNFHEDGDNGQVVWDFHLGWTKFWKGRHQLDLNYHHFRIERDNPNFSSFDKSTNNSLSIEYSHHFSDKFSLTIGGKINDNLFRGEWPFLDREVDALNFSNYGHFNFGFTYRFDYSNSRP